MTELEPIADLLRQFTPISLEEMQAVKLMNRVDTKFLTSRSVLPFILEQLSNSYFVQETSGKRLSSYQTLYYDTEDVQMYLVHHDRKLTRQKLRARIYCDTQTAFCEIKNKNNKKRTKKKRTEMSPELFGNMLSDALLREFVDVNLQYDVSALLPQVENQFYRITLVNKEKTERLTIDLDIRFRNRTTGIGAEIGELVIIELKQDGNMPSPFKKLMQQLRVRPKRISKYCIGTILTRPGVKMNRFKRKLRYIEKITQQNAVNK